MLKLSPPLPPPRERDSGVLPEKMNLYIAAREILCISDDINMMLIHWFRRQKMLKPSPPLPPLEVGGPGSSQGNNLSFYIAVRDF